jgi:antitoxin component HigA of HigAB toxin-antitoxin module
MYDIPATDDERVEAMQALYDAHRAREGLDKESPEVRWIRRFMWRTELTQRWICEEIGMDESYFSKVMSGKRELTPIELGRLIKVIGPFPTSELKFYYEGGR